MRAKELVYSVIMLILFLILVIVFFIATGFLSKSINGLFSFEGAGVTDSSLQLDLNNYSLVAKKLNILRANTTESVATTSTSTATTTTSSASVVKKNAYIAVEKKLAAAGIKFQRDNSQVNTLGAIYAISNAISRATRLYAIRDELNNEFKDEISISIVLQPGTNDVLIIIKQRP